MGSRCVAFALACGAAALRRADGQTIYTSNTTWGCIDADFANYDPDARTDDGSCRTIPDMYGSCDAEGQWQA